MQEAHAATLRGLDREHERRLRLHDCLEGSASGSSSSSSATATCLGTFISLLTNRRQDEHGGPLKRRMQFPLAVVDATRAAFMRTERVLTAHAAQPFDLSGTESPKYLCRAVAALAGDPELMRRTG